MTIKASVIIPTHNRPDSLRQTVASLKRQSLPSSEYELIVVDDGSRPAVMMPTDTTGPACKLVRLEGLERSAARNAGASAASGNLLIFVDDDMRVEAGFVAAHLKAQHDWPGALVVGAIRLDNNGARGPFRDFRERIESNSVPKMRGLVELPNFCAAGNFSIPREAFEALRGFDVKLVSGEDQDLAFRHTANAALIAYAPDARALHDDSAVDIRGYCKRSEWGMAHIVQFIALYPEWPANAERAAVNGPVRFAREPLSRTISKLVKLGLATKPSVSLLFALSSLLEWTAPNSVLLTRCYKLLLGVHLFRGYRAGFAKEHRDSTVLKWPIRDIHPASGATKG